MTGCIFKRRLRSGASWGYSISAGRDSAGRRIQIFKSGFATKGSASEAMRSALAEHEANSTRVSSKLDLFGNRVWSFSIGGAVTSGFKSRDDAESARTIALSHVAAEETKRIDLANITFAEYFEDWINEHASRRCVPKTVERYRELGRYLMKDIGTTPLNSLTTALIQEMIHRLTDHGGRVTEDAPNGRPLAAKTVRHIGTLLFTALAEADRLGVMTISNPMANKRVRLPKLTKRSPAVLDQDKLRLLFERAEGTRLRPLLVLAAAAGCLRGELLALIWNDVDTKSGEITISKSLEQTKAGGLRVKSTKSEKPRRFAVPEWALEVLAAHRAEQNGDRELFGADSQDSGLIFCQPNGSHYSPDRVGARVVELMHKVGLEGVSMHSLRHSHASALLSKGVPIAVVSERLGHADQNITLSIYSHALPADTRAAARIWNEAMSDVIHASRKPAAHRMLADVSRKGLRPSRFDDSKEKRVAGTTGLEPATSDVTGRRSNQLSYVPECCVGCL